MNKWLKAMIPVYISVFLLFLIISFGGNRAISVLSENMPVTERSCIIIDPGHGGEDGGAISCTGITESKINLEISLRLRDLFNLIGYKTKMIRETDVSIYTKGDTLSAKKVSDLKERVRIVSESDDSLLISIHQNTFPNDHYTGAQIFYNTNSESKLLAEKLQNAFINTLNPGSRRTAKKASGIYLLEHIKSPAVLVECGFLTNPQEEARLRSSSYQQNICCVIAATISCYLDG